MYFPWCYLFTLINYAIVVYSIEVEISTPVNPVEVGAIFSVLCQVRGLNSKHEVALYRTTEKNVAQRLSSKEDVDTEIDESVFLAVRRQIDGSEVYFLTITGKLCCGSYFFLRNTLIDYEILKVACLLKNAKCNRKTYILDREMKP